MSLTAAGAILATALFGCKDAPSRLDAYLKAAESAWDFTGAVLVAWDGQVVLSRGYGMADRTFGDLNSPQTKFHIGSITKQFTAAAIMLLQEEGRLTVQDKISKFLPNYPTGQAEQITIHHLLTHTSGIPNYTDFPEVVLSRTSQISPGALMQSFRDWPLEFEPGTGFHYSNSNYIVLGAIIEAVSGQSYEAFLHHRFFRPLGMRSTGYGRREAGVPDLAEGYTLDAHRDYVEAVRTHLSVLHTAGALYSTVEDMLVWDQALYSDRVLLPSSVTTMLTPGLGDYGYGWVIDSLYGRCHAYHGGFIDGFNCVYERWPDDRLCVIVFSNEDLAPVKKMARALAAIAFGEKYDMPLAREAVPIDTALLKEYEGAYETGADVYRLIAVAPPRVYSYFVGQSREQLKPLAPDTFFYDSDHTRILTFTRGPDGRVDGQLLYDEGVWYRAERIEGPVADSLLLLRAGILIDPVEYSHYTGQYELEAPIPGGRLKFILTVYRRDSQLFITASSIKPVEVFPSGHGDFFHRSGRLRIRFTVDELSRVIGCILSLGGSEIQGRKLP